MKFIRCSLIMILTTFGLTVLIPQLAFAQNPFPAIETNIHSAPSDMDLEQIHSAEEFADIVSVSLSYGEETPRFAKKNASLRNSQQDSLYALKRIIVSGDVALIDTFGADKAYVFKEGNEYILEYPTGECTAAAYEALVSAYGKENVALDQILSMEDFQISSDISAASAASPDLWGLHLMGLDTLKKKAEGVWTKKTIAAVVDTGIDTDHPWFKGRISKESISLISGETYEDRTGHGTHVSGIIAQGTTSAVDIMAIRLFNNEGDTTISLLLAAMDYVNEKNPDVVNMSLGKTTPTSTAWETSILESKFETYLEKGGVLCVSAGNEARPASLSYPASSPNTITISSISKSITEPTSYYFSNSFSNYGALIDFTAPGEWIESAWIDGNTKSIRGTSMSCPHVTAAAAMIKSRHSDYSQQKVYQEMVDYSVDMGEKGKDEYYGHGYINLTDYFKNNPLKNSQAPQKNQTISVSKSSYKKVYGASRFSLGAKGHGNLSYKSSKPSAVSVNQKGSITIKGVGKAVITIKAAGTSIYKPSSRKVSITVNPQKVTVTKGTGGKKKIQLAWKKLPYVSGYQIRYSTRSNMASSKKRTVNKAKTTRSTINSLKAKKTYYIQVRAFKKVSGSTFYGHWSKTKKIKTK